MRKKYLLIVGLSLLMHSLSFSQKEDESCLPPNKKVLKVLTEAKEAKDVKTRIDAYMKAISEAPDNALPYYEYATYAYDTGVENYNKFPDPSRGDKSFLKAEEMFIETLERCPDYHSLCLYYLGVINYSQNDMPEAMKWFKQYQAFKNDDPNKYPDDHDKKLNDIKEVIAKYEKDRSFKDNPVPYEPRKVENVSSPSDEYFPMISPDNEIMFYTRKVNIAGLGERSKIVEDFTFSFRPNVDALFDKGASLDYPFNDGSFASYGAATMSVDNKEIIFCACNPTVIREQNYMNCDLYRSVFRRSGKGGNDYVWSKFENLGTGINTPDGWEGQPTLSPDGNELYFATNRPTTLDNDIYVAKRKPDGTWGNAVPFDVVNTRGKDKSPFLHQDSETLYFVSSCSDERPGVGGTDIFYIRKDENGKWTEPKNIGYPINSPDDELGIFVSTDGTLAYFSSRYGGDWNIYSFELYEEARPTGVTILKGELKDELGEPVQDATVEIAYEGEEKVTTVKVNGDDGKYAAVVKNIKEKDVMVTVKKEGHAFDSKLIPKEKFIGEVSMRDNNLQVKELKVGAAYTINDILFPTASYQLSSKSKFILKQFARYLVENPTITITIQGHTDDMGEDQTNLELSEKRAQEVKAYLIAAGVKSERLEAKGFGETMPKVPNDSEANRAKNRRTDFVIISL
jgi:outer membrane protein OmpA-like peptidoglycan-associated protein/Tol biopolymer transport system component